ncbi:uncharacterized protein I206_100811 [Kwoniella pini CBS 10737]|uniref:Uncharacterized protein n=1 Tax=Kwoniella pini CBS 10737 TaxID=1296096 RepID=A0A1B9IC27_9TREE|nr:uncharacterized protein I206_00516 [Kwoniella pini CBS 10737]OCF53215.1 hypothetical protein I206_00516 [Kwoniella pini CBS 10737]
MDNSPWNILNQYCQDPTQREWVAEQLTIAPIPFGQSPEDWLLARSMVAEGMTESQAWSQVHTLRQNQNQNPQHNSINPMFASQTFQNQNGFHQDPVLPNLNVTNSIQPAYGFVSLQDVAPRPQQASQRYQEPRNPSTVPVFNPSQPQIPTQVLPSYAQNLSPEQLRQLYLQHQNLLRASAQANAVAGPSISTHLVQPSRQLQVQNATYRPPPIDLTLSDSPPRDQSVLSPNLNQSSRTQSPIQLIPPGSRRTPDLVPHRQLSVQTAPGQKRPLVPLPQNDNPNNLAKRVKSNSSSIDPPVQSNGIQLLSDSGSTAKPAEKTEPTMKDVREFLTSNYFRTGKPMELFKFLRKREKKGEILPPQFTPNPKQVFEIVSAIRDHAPDSYLKKMAEDDRYCDVWGVWLFKAFKEIEKWESTIVPIFQVLAKTDMPFDNYEDARLRTRSRKVADLAMTKGLDSRNDIQLAYQKYEVWVKNHILPKAKKEASDDEKDDSNNKKRKIDDLTNDKSGTSNLKLGTSKLPATAPMVNGTKPLVKPAAASIASSSKVSTGKSAADMSFFGSTPSSSSSTATKVIGKLPEFKKKPTPTTNAPSQSASSSASSLLIRTMQGLKAVPNPQVPISQSSTAGQSPVAEVKKEEVKPRYNSKGKLIRNVRFKDDVKSEEGGGALEQVKEFTQEAKEFERFEWEPTEEEEDEVRGHSAHDLDMAEGAALASARGHAMIDWYDPTPYTESSHEVNTPEVQHQTIRENGSLALYYPPGLPIPDPTENDVVIIEGDISIRKMDPVNAGQDILEYQSGGQYRAPPTQNSGNIIPPIQQGSIGNLLNSLKGIPLPVHQQQQQNTYESYGYNQPPPPPPLTNQTYQNGWTGTYETNHDERQWGNNGIPQNNYQRNYDNYNIQRETRPIDRDPNVPICRFWPRGE